MEYLRLRFEKRVGGDFERRMIWVMIDALVNVKETYLRTHPRLAQRRPIAKEALRKSDQDGAGTARV